MVWVKLPHHVKDMANYTFTKYAFVSTKEHCQDLLGKLNELKEKDLEWCGDLIKAFGYGYKEKQDGKEIQHWDIHTAQFIFYCTKEPLGWKVEMQQNPTGKINIIYYRQNKAWEGVEPRIGREEMLDSKIGDTNNYFAEPIAKATADVVDMLGDPDTPARMIQMSKDGQFEYITPPASSELQQREKENLKESILFDTFTPDFSFETLKGFGTLSGAAIRNAMIL